MNEQIMIIYHIAAEPGNPQNIPLDGLKQWFEGGKEKGECFRWIG